MPQVAMGQANEADIVCFPEMNITGYIDPVKDSHAVLSIDHSAVSQVIQLSGLYSICVITGFVEYNPIGKPFINQFVAHNGKLLGFYRKKTIKDDEVDWFTPGDQQPVFSVFGLIFGLSVSADIDDPDIFSEYAQKSAAIVFESAAPGLYGEQNTRNWQSGFNWWRSNCMEKLGKYAADESLSIAVAHKQGVRSTKTSPVEAIFLIRKGNVRLNRATGARAFFMYKFQFNGIKRDDYFRCYPKYVFLIMV